MGKAVNKKELALILGKSEASLTAWQHEGMPVTKITGQRGNQYDTAEIIEWLIKRAISGKGEHNAQVYDLNVERARLAKEQADKTEFDNQVRRGELVDAGEIEGAWLDICSDFKSRMLALPSRLSPRLLGVPTVPEINGILTAGVVDALSALEADNEANLSGDVAAAEAEHQPVGGQVQEA